MLIELIILSLNSYLTIARTILSLNSYLALLERFFRLIRRFLFNLCDLRIYNFL